MPIGKPPPNTPTAVGDFVKLRGREATGRLSEVTGWNWARVAWDDGALAPEMVHLYELERLSSQRLIEDST
jgi:hypothetical protein